MRTNKTTKVFFCASFFSLIFFFMPISFAFADGIVSIHVRYEDFVAFDGTTTLPDATTTTLNDSNGVPRPISSDSALYLLSTVASSSQTFSMSDLEYYSSFGEFYVNCLDINATSTIHACGNWQYAVNGGDPSVGSDQYIATTSDNIYFYYGNQRQFSVSATSTDTVTPIVVTVQKYDYTNNSWLPLSGETVDATEPNPSDEWNPFIIATSTSDASGTASLLISDAGTYNIGLSDNGFYPTQITVATATEATSSETETTSPASESGSGGGGGASHQNINITNAFGFLESNEGQDGSFDSVLYTDWAAVAFGAGSENSYRDKITAYERSVSPKNFSSATDYERHAMALEALGINPYTGTDTDYIQKIIDDFDGTEVGDPSLVNGDIFAIFPLVKAGYSANDPIIQKIVGYIVSKQNADGSWNESVDLTAAAIQALAAVPSVAGTLQAQNRAQAYILSEQESNGGFGSDGSTSWSLQAIAALGESGSSWTDSGNDPNDYLYNLQQTDGGIGALSEDENTRVWETSYAIPAALGDPWLSILSSFSKPAGISSAASVSIGASTNQTEQVVATTTNAAEASSSPVVFQTTPIPVVERAVVSVQTTKRAQPKDISTSTKESESTSTQITTVPSKSPDKPVMESVVVATTCLSALAVGIYLLIII